MSQPGSDHAAQVAEFTELLGSLWGQATLSSRARGGLPVLPPSQARGLRLVIAEEGMTPTRLAEAMGMSRPMVSDIVRKLEEAELVERRRSTADGRSVVVSATEHGRFVQRSFHAGVAESVAEAFAALAPEDLYSLLAAVPALRRLHAQLTTIAARDEAEALHRSRRDAAAVANAHP